MMLQMVVTNTENGDVDYVLFSSDYRTQQYLTFINEVLNDGTYVVGRRIISDSSQERINSVLVELLP